MNLIALGMFVLIFSWVSFNPGFRMAAIELRISVIAVNTFLAGAAGGYCARFGLYAMKTKKSTQGIAKNDPFG